LFRFEAGLGDHLVAGELKGLHRFGDPDMGSARCGLVMAMRSLPSLTNHESD